jgi:hypothetical protein
MEITNYWAQSQVQQNKASASAASTMEFLNTAAKGSGSNNSGSSDASQSAISGASMVTNFSASLAAANVDAASTGNASSTTPDFTNMSDNQMSDWVISQVASGAMTNQQSLPFLTLALRTQDSPLPGFGGNIANTAVPHNFITEAKQYMAGEDHATARFIKPALDMMLKLQSQSSQNTGAPAGMAQSQTASSATASVGSVSTGTASSTTPDFTNMSDNQMWGWVNSQIASGAMTKEQADPYLTLASRTQDSPLLGGNIANTTVPHNFITEAQQYMAGEDHATATSIKPALDMMLKLQSQSSQNAGNLAGTAQSQTASSTTASVGIASTGTTTSTTPDFTHTTDQQMWSWINSQVASGTMTKEQSSPFINMTLNTPAQEFALTGDTTGAVNGTATSVSQPANSSTNTPVFHNFINLAQQYMASEDHASATFIKPALDMMLKLQSQSSQDIGADLSLRNSTGTAQSQTASSATASVGSASTGTASSTTPDFTNMTRQQMLDWMNA